MTSNKRREPGVWSTDDRRQPALRKEGTDDRQSAMGPARSGIRKISSVKMLIATASVAATVGGWAQLTHHNNEIAGPSQTSQLSLSQVVVQSDQPALQFDSLALPAIPSVPTVVPARDFTGTLWTQGLDSAGAQTQADIVAPTPIPPQPTPQPQSPPALRQVTIPQPAPRVVTRSSR